MRNYFLAMTVALLITNCATYSPVQHIGGERHQGMAALESCSFDILTFPVDPKNTSIAGGMNALNINASQVYSIEFTHWMYLWPLVAQKCVYFHMNSKYIASNTLKTTGSTSSAPMVMQTPGAAEATVAPEAPGEITGNMDADFNACDDLMRMERSQCRKKVYNHYRNLEKQKK
jgi:hypothetical protein